MRGPVINKKIMTHKRKNDIYSIIKIRNKINTPKRIMPLPEVIKAVYLMDPIVL